MKKKEKIGKILKIIPVLIFVLAIGTAIGIKAKADNIAEKIVRFHIVADDDSEDAQCVKWEIRKKIFEYANAECINSKEKALEYFINEKRNIEAIADEELEKNGLPYKCRVYVGKKYFPVREYSAFILPSGVYDTVSIILGKGKGKNFFCVMYPSVCSVSSITEKTNDNSVLLGSVLSEEETRLVTDVGNKTIFKLKLLEIVEKFLSN